MMMSQNCQRSVASLELALAVVGAQYRLYDIDRLISRTLADAILIGLLVGVYAGLLLVATEVFRFHTPVAVAAATLAAATLFNPHRPAGGTRLRFAPRKFARYAS